MDIQQLLAFTVKQGASDLHLSAGVAPMIRVDGNLRRVNAPALEPSAVEQMLLEIMDEHQQAEYRRQLECDFALAVDGLGRFRVNAFFQSRGASAVFRCIPECITALDELNGPAVLQRIAGLSKGLVLVTGPTGSGKSTTLAALVDHKNRHEHGHILTVEDPVEFVHEPKKCLINQREIHRDSHSFSAALRSALREDPDTILVGELRDLETIRLALTAAETGHLVLATLHTSSAAKTITRVVDVFPAAEKELVRTMLADSLRAVISQTLLRQSGGGRVAAFEVLVANAAVRNMIRENKVAQLYSAMQTGQKDGMQTHDQAVQEMARKGLVDPVTSRHSA